MQGELHDHYNDRRELVKNFQCSLYSSKAMNCSWLPANQASDLQLYYGYLGPSHIAACSEYQYRDGQRTGCHLRGSFLQYDVYFKVNGTLDGLSVQNNFLVLPRYHVKPPAPKVKITEEGRNLILSWDPPDIGAVHCWNFILKYNKCQESLGKEIQLEHVPGKVSYDQRCQYRVKLKAVYTKWCGEGGSDWSEEEIYGTEIRFSPKIPPRTLTALLNKSVRSGSSAIDHRSALQL
ncbi:interleukin-13 receptor subunit alpha-2-like isoform X3 [Oncorhynchus kisutch]|uniref:interleukin-13 receptor subunit alpha-2-like isoform X3 n=1 Tax=Oncorhynchus kisutch TaxID=8019 RepID=UPI00099F5218|nr:interleukin-13 receptor subunit alpha-2-like isoform X3 [Oncorhynchus kisutch]XP_031688171.1 interleukin-13 receptor subunit alpha-2-like isoform X3 [Oncorhynchus kisutch]XP_031688172.1 interleukin-13 receptor subunit alpha-2-like isoform X3 [Oncorhynchus kisutch]